MAYENKPKIIRDKDKDRSTEERTSLDRQKSTRESRAQEKEIKKQRREALNQATSTKERREIKKAAEEATLATRGPSSSGGSDKGGIYDISTNNYSQPQRNQSGQDSSIEEAGIDTLGAGEASSASDSSVEFNGSVLICINGSPFYIDIPYDSDAGVYPSSDGANFPITAPE
tara:strand:- start:104 stop:619 length:516 start_codon:yes stop_codon:yes gene_type:complete